MIPVTELLNLALFDDFQLAAGESGLKNQVGNIVILEYESYNKHYEVFGKGDFVLTSLFFAKDEPLLIEEALLNLMGRQISAIAIKAVFYHELPENVYYMADKLHIPIFFFERAYMEDLIIVANELLKSKRQYLIFEEKITELIETAPSSHINKETAHEINSAFSEKLSAAYLIPKNSSGSAAVTSYFQRLFYKRYQASGIYPYAYVKYREGMFLFLSEEDIEDIVPQVLSLLKGIDLNPEQFIIGIADTPLPQEQFSDLITCALDASLVCRMKGESLMLYSSLGTWQFLAPLCRNHNVMTSCRSQIDILTDYDRRYTSNLLTTLETYIESNGEIALTAGKLFQHPNTIRYRLRKVCALLNCSFQELYSHAFILISLYQLTSRNELTDTK